MTGIKHVAIIMDGNGRWAKEKLRPRIWGHIKGSQIVSQIVEEASALSLKALTLYAFSTENWKRPEKEKSVLFRLLKKYLQKESKSLIENQVRFKVIGSVDKVPDRETKDLVLELEERTKDMSGLKLNLAFDYGSRSELMAACNRYVREEKGSFVEELFNKYLYTETSGEVDLLIRTGGEKRISNFLLWQIAYAELYFTNTKWPEFSPEDFRNIIKEVSIRERRFGLTSEQIDLLKSESL